MIRSAFERAWVDVGWPLGSYFQFRWTDSGIRDEQKMFCWKRTMVKVSIVREHSICRGFLLRRESWFSLIKKKSLFFYWWNLDGNDPMERKRAWNLRKCEAIRVKQEEMGLLYKDKEPSDLLYQEAEAKGKGLVLVCVASQMVGCWSGRLPVSLHQVALSFVEGKGDEKKGKWSVKLHVMESNPSCLLLQMWGLNILIISIFVQ